MKIQFILVWFIIGLVWDANAQFEAGESFVSGSFHSGFHSNSYTSAGKIQSSFEQYSLESGKFLNSNRTIGWRLSAGLDSFTQTELPYKVESPRILDLGVGRFAEFYKTFSDKLGIYVKPSVGIDYKLSKDYFGDATTLFNETVSNYVDLGGRIEGGMAWRVSPKWAVIGTVAFLNPLRISASFSKTSYFDEDPYEVRERSFRYNFDPTESTLQLSIGLRYVYRKKTNR